MRKAIAFLLVRIAFKICPESKAVKEFATYIATASMIDGGYVTIVKPEEFYKEPSDATDKTKKETSVNDSTQDTGEQSS